MQRRSLSRCDEMAVMVMVMVMDVVMVMVMVMIVVMVMVAVMVMIVEMVMVVEMVLVVVMVMVVIFARVVDVVKAHLFLNAIFDTKDRFFRIHFVKTANLLQFLLGINSKPQHISTTRRTRLQHQSSTKLRVTHTNTTLC